MRSILSLVLMLVATAGLVLSTGLMPSPANQGGSAYAQAQGVLHVEAEQITEPKQGAAVPAFSVPATQPTQTAISVWKLEFWLDLSSRDARFVAKDLAGNEESIEVRKGSTVTNHLPTKKIMSSETAADSKAGFLTRVEDRLLSYKSLLDRGQVKPAGEEVVAGQQATRVELVDAHGGGAVHAYVSKANGLPLKEVFYHRGATGALEELSVRTTSYSRVEQVRRDQVPVDVFAPPVVGADWHKESSRALTQATARFFQEYDLYWLGSSYDGLPLYGISHKQFENPTGKPYSRLSQVSVLYADPISEHDDAGRGQIAVVQRPALTLEDVASRERALGSAAKGEQVTARGYQGALYLDGTTARLELTIGQTFVQIHGSSRTQVLQAAQSLTKLN